MLRIPLPNWAGQLRRYAERHLSKPDPGRSDHRQSIREVHFKNFVQPLPHKRSNRASSRGLRSKQNDTRILVCRVSLEIRNALVEREQNAIRSESGINDRWVFRTTKSFVDNRVSLMAQVAEIRRQFHREVLIKLEPHDALIGTRRSS